MNFQNLKVGLALGACVLLGGCVSYPRQQPVTTPAVIQAAPIGAPAPFPVQPPPGAVVVPAPPSGPPCATCNPVPPPPPGPIVQPPR